jgi:chorismate mutase
MVEADKDPQALLAVQREIIDRADRDIVALANERATASLAIASIKHRHGLPIFVEGREDQVIANAISINQGPFSNMQVTKIVVGIMRESRQLQGELMRLEEAIEGERQ